MAENIEDKIEKLVLKIGLKRLHKVFKIIRNVYITVDYILTVIFGYSLVFGWKNDQIEARQSGKGHVVKILGRGTDNPASQSFLENFMLRHEAYIDPIGLVSHERANNLSLVSDFELTI